MASVQWGNTTTSALTFTTSAALGNLPAGAGSVAFLWKPVTFSAQGADAGGLRDAASGGTGNFYRTLGVQNGSNQFWIDDNSTVNGVSTALFSNWYITVVTWPSGTAQTPRFHFQNLTTGAAWVHENATSTISNRTGIGTAGFFRVGYVGDWQIGSGQQIALTGAWNVALSDGNAAALSTNLKTSDWYNNAGGTPIFLSEITSLTPTDLTGGGSAFSAGNSVLTELTVGGEPVFNSGSWTFDGIGSGGGTLNVGVIN